MRYEVTFSCMSHIGKVRSINQDNFICDGTYMKPNAPMPEFPLSGKKVIKAPTLFGIFDGMGGEECGEIASLIASEVASKAKLRRNGIEVLSDLCTDANARICTYTAENNVSSMGTTAAMLLFSENKITLCNVGDSKIFMLSGGELIQISQDHVAIAPFGRKPPLSQNLGIPPDQLIIEPYYSQGCYRDGDRYLITSDGLTDMVRPDEIRTLMESHPTEELAEILVEKALENGGLDNVTVIILELKQRKNNLFDILCRKNGGEEL